MRNVRKKRAQDKQNYLRNKGKKRLIITGRTRRNTGHLPGRPPMPVIGRTLRRKGRPPVPVIGRTLRRKGRPPVLVIGRTLRKEGQLPAYPPIVVIGGTLTKKGQQLI